MSDRPIISWTNRAPLDSQDDTITGLSQLSRRLPVDPETLSSVVQTFPMKVNGYYLSLINHPQDPLGRQVLPDLKELEDQQTEVDPLTEAIQSPVPQIIHRYPQRVIFLVSNLCAAGCRFCMRKRLVAKTGQVAATAIEDGIAYIRTHKEINEVILSGGDPFMLNDKNLLEILTFLKRIDHIRILRIHTRIPCVWPQRITPSLARQLSAFHPLYINIHFNHPAEITPESARACTLLADAGISLGSQTVLLKGVNDDANVLHKLMESLLEIRVRPYYLHQLDRVPGTAHFQVPIEKGLELMASLRGHLSGMAMPHYMIDIPGGGGKIELLPESVLRKEPDHWVISNFKGRVYHYPIR